MVTMFSVVCFIMEICNSGKVGELRQTVNLLPKGSAVRNRPPPPLFTSVNSGL